MSTSTDLVVTRLRAQSRDEPLGLGTGRPALSWCLRSSRRGVTQRAYRILAASDPALVNDTDADLWDSGRVESGDSQYVRYAGAAPGPRRTCHWRVQVWDDLGAVAVSDVAVFETGLLDEAEWVAAWVALPRPHDVTDDHRPAPYLRRQFPVGAGLVRARVYATAAGLYELHCNGARVGDDRFRPGWTDYHQRVQYQTYDVTGLLREGDNALGVVLGDGWYAGYLGWDEPPAGRRRGVWGQLPLARVQVVLDYADGRSETVVTDGGWRGAFGPIRISDLFLGEIYDARRELTGWSAPGYDDGGWRPVEICDGPAGRVVAQQSPSVRVTQDLPAVAVTEPLPGSYVFDLGQNMVGWARLAVRGPAGTIVRLRFAEMLRPDGTLYTENLRAARATDTYVLRGDPHGEVWEPSFTFHGFRYVEVTGYPGVPHAGAVTGRVAHTDAPLTGAFECAHPLVDRLYRNIVWGQRGNFLEVPTDCPQRDERLGWLGDAQVFARTACYTMDLATFFTKWLDDVADAQSPQGAFPDVAPRVVNEADGAPGWGDAGVIVPWTVYQFSGDRRLLERHWPAMARWVDYVHRANPDLLWTEQRNNDFGDWLEICEPGDAAAVTGMFSHLTPAEVLATAFFAHSARLVAAAAGVLDRDADAARYGRLADDIAAAFTRAYVDDEGRIAGDTQTGYALALRFGLLPEPLRAVCAARLAADVERRGHLTTGFLGVAHLLPALTRAGRLDLAYRLLLSEEYPSWGYSIRHGATTIWERWDGWTPERGFQSPGMNSFNHYSLGSVGEWLYETVGGLAPGAPGWHHVLVAPRPGGGLDRARTALDTPYGPVSCGWRVAGDVVEVDVEIPANTTATVRLPAGGEVHESGRAAATAPGVRRVALDGTDRVLDVGSGSYRFRVGPAGVPPPARP